MMKAHSGIYPLGQLIGLGGKVYSLQSVLMSLGLRLCV
jgi:hypothetical protein